MKEIKKEKNASFKIKFDLIYNPYKVISTTMTDTCKTHPTNLLEIVGLLPDFV